MKLILKNKAKALTIIELIVVMGIIAIVITLGVWGMVSFQKSVTIQQSTDEIISVLNETKSLAENNVLPKDITVNAITNPNGIFAYQLSFLNNTLTRSLCQYNQNTFDWDCGIYPINLKSDVLNDITFNNTLGNACTRIIFENLTGNLWVYSTLNISYAADLNTCELKLKYLSTDLKAYLDVKGNGNTFKFSYL